MSVQAGIWNFDGRPVDRKLIDDLSESLKQQGPDGESRYADGPIALLYRPFHTTAESRREKQPYVSRQGLVLTWDGRLDNREVLVADLRSDLDASPTDIAIFAAAFDRWDTDCFRRIVGDWAVSVWKPEQRELLFASDYMAIRHVFYYLKNDRIWWSTDLSPLVLLSGDKFHIDDDYIAGYFAHDPDAHLTPYREIREIPAGQFVRIRDGKASVARHWRFSSKSRVRYKTDAEYEEHFRHVFRQSVHRRLRSDSPVLAELSGGLDSSSIVCMADDIGKKEGSQVPRLDTLSYCDRTEPNADDWLYLQEVELHRGRTGHHIDAGTLGSSPGSLASGDFMPLPGYLGSVRRLEAERAAAVQSGRYRAVLSGVGGDEFLGGIPNPSAQLADLMAQFKFIELVQALMTWSLVKRRPWIQLLGQASLHLIPPSLGQYFAKCARVEPWIRRDFAKRTKLAIRLLDVDEHFGLWLPSRRACIGGVVLMANKLAKWRSSPHAPEESRYPYLDQDVIEFVLSIPATQLLRPGERRSLMRRSLRGIVPQIILSRLTKQVGARTPVLTLEKSLGEVRTAFQARLSANLGYVDQTVFLNKLGTIKRGAELPIISIARTISFELWLHDLVSRCLLDVPRVSHLVAAPSLEVSA